MVVKKEKFHCKSCGVWSFWNQENKGNCLICFPRKRKVVEKATKQKSI